MADKGLTSLLLAIYLDKSESTISDWCGNKRQPSDEDFHKIADFLRLDVRDLIVSTKPEGNQHIAEKMIEELDKFKREDKPTYIYKTTPEGKQNKYPNPELIERLKAIIQSDGRIILPALLSLGYIPGGHHFIAPMAGNGNG